MSKISIRFYNDREVRAVWDEENSKWWFSAIDIIRAINDEVGNFDTPLLKKQEEQVKPIELKFTLSWSHYLKLMRIDNPEEYQTSSYHLQAIDRDKKSLEELEILHR